MVHPYVQFLVERDLIPANVAKRLRENRNFVRQPIGMIAVSHGLLQPNHIDAILDQQRHSDARFGDIAVEMGYLSRDQVNKLVKVQEFRAAADITEALALGGVFSVEDANRCLGSYLVGDREVIAMMSDD